MINLHFMVFKMLIFGLCYGFSNVWAVDIVFHDLYISYTFKSIHVVKVGDLIAPKVYVSSTVKISKFRCQHEHYPTPMSIYRSQYRGWCGTTVMTVVLVLF